MAVVLILLGVLAYCAIGLVFLWVVADQARHEGDPPLSDEYAGLTATLWPAWVTLMLLMGLGHVVVWVVARIGHLAARAVGVVRDPRP